MKCSSVHLTATLSMTKFSTHRPDRHQLSNQPVWSLSWIREGSVY